MTEPAEPWWRKLLRIVGIIPENGSAPILTDSQAGVRVGLASIIQAAGTLFVGFPLVLKMGPDGWERDCFHIGLTFGVGGILVLWATTYYIMFADRVNVVLTESIIRVIYITNILALSIAMARVGDPSSSVFGHVIPLQLSGMLLLEQQTDSMTSRSRYAPLKYGVIALVIWAVAAGFRIVPWPFLTGKIEACTSGCDDKLATYFLIPSEIIFTVVAYYLAIWKRFRNFFEKKPQVPSNQQTT
jgi:hypothetical protein